jgi:glucose-6-phosphate 1-epimerase
MDLQQLTDHFAIPDVLTFSQNENGLLRASITTPACTAELYLQGAHLSRWQPTGQKPVFFLSDRSAFTPGKAIRGGVPIVFPWFGGRTATAENQRTDGPSHGFARTADWTLAFAALAGDDLHLTLTLSPNDTTRALGYDQFQLAYQVTLGTELRLQLAVANQSAAPLHFEEAFHSYFSVGDVQQISLIGLSDTDYLDKTDEFKPKHQSDTLLKLTGETDRPYLDTVATINLDDPILKRRITVCKANSKSTVIWNPWSELTAKLPDMDPNGWLTLTCVETANVATNTITLAPGQQHSMQAHIFVQEFAEGYNAEQASQPPKPSHPCP